MVIKKRLLTLALVLTLGASFGAHAQVKEYLKEAEALSTLYRGRLPAQYSFLYNGTYYWDSKTFTKGNVFYNGKWYEDVYVNVDAVKQELLVRLDESVAPVALYTDMVSAFTTDNKLFVNLRYMGYTEAPEGFFQVVRDGSAPLLMQVRKQLLGSTGNHNGKPIGYNDPNYNQSVNEYFSRIENCYTITSGKVVKMRRRAFNKALDQHVKETPFLRNQTGVWKGTTETADVAVEDVKTGGIGLPDNYFAAIQSKENAEESTGITASYRNKIYVIGSGNAKEVRVEGVVTELETGLPLPGTVIFDDNTATYARTNAKGQYSITLPGGENILNFNAESKEPMALRVDLRGNGSLSIELPDKVELLKASVVSAQSMANHRNTTMGVETVSIATMNKIPSAFGEGDIIKAVLTLPGVKTVGEASGGFNVRGGAQDQNLILFNGNTIYNPSHLFGIFSAFNPDIVEDAQLYKSSIPAQYGGRISSVLSVRSKPGNMEKIKGSVGIGLLTSRAHLEGPVSDKTSFNIGGRTTYSDWILRMLPKNSYYSGGNAGFYDVNAGITHRFSQENTLQINGYYASDRFLFGSDSTSFNYTNLNASAEFRHKEADGLNYQISLGYDQYNNRTGIREWAEGAYDLDTYIRQAFLRTLFAIPAGNHTISFGADAVGYALDPGIVTPFGTASDVVARSLKREYAVEPALWVSDNWQLAESFSMEGGIRLSSFLFMDPSTFYIGPEFRFSARYSPMPNLSFKAGINSMRQYIHLISNTSSISPMDTWKLSDPDIAPTTGWQAAGGIYWTHMDSGIDLSLEAYWKNTKNGLDYKPGATLSMNEHLADELLPVLGRAYGVEAMIKKTTGKLTGWASYSYSRTRYKEMGNSGAQAIAGGNWYNAPYDKPHEFKLAANWAMTHRFSLSANVDYSTGRPVTVPVGKYNFGGTYRLAYSERNAYRIPDYFRIDLAFNVDPGHNKRHKLHPTFTIGVYNVTGRKNPYSVYFTSDKNGSVQGHMLSVFASQIPYANINILF